VKWFIAEEVINYGGKRIVYIVFDYADPSACCINRYQKESASDAGSIMKEIDVLITEIDNPSKYNPARVVGQ